GRKNLSVEFSASLSPVSRFLVTLKPEPFASGRIVNLVPLRCSLGVTSKALHPGYASGGDAYIQPQARMRNSAFRFHVGYNCDNGGDCAMPGTVEPVMDKKEIFRRIEEIRDDLAAMGVCCVSLFGSFVRGEQTERSDVDLLVEFSKEMHTFDNFMETAFLLETIMGRRTEVVTLESLSPHISPYVTREMERIDVAA
ncbi:MAG: nucleotidyltransferase domain-containing protein, partial [Synergistota bacterium]|nr:nucleotidyltransferase domain-containing protein [Synergistota bacterium]